MGTGKSSVGIELAKQMSLGFVDLDKMIVEKEKKQISEIFSQDGEPYFRMVEKEVLKEVSLKDGQVIACGGGIVIDPANIRLMKEKGRMICLGASPQKILERTKGTSVRPLLNVPDPMKKIEALLKQRQPFYLQSDKIIDTDGLSIKDVVKEIIIYIKDND